MMDSSVIRLTRRRHRLGTCGLRVVLALAAMAPTAGFAQARSNQTLQNVRDSTRAVVGQPPISESARITPNQIPTRQDFEALQDQQLSEMSEQLAGLKNDNDRLRAELASVRADVDRINTAMRPPPGYSAAFTTKRNWDGLDGNVGIKYFAPYGR